MRGEERREGEGRGGKGRREGRVGERREGQGCAGWSKGYPGEMGALLGSEHWSVLSLFSHGSARVWQMELGVGRSRPWMEVLGVGGGMGGTVGTKVESLSSYRGSVKGLRTPKQPPQP